MIKLVWWIVINTITVVCCLCVTVPSCNQWGTSRQQTPGEQHASVVYLH